MNKNIFQLCPILKAEGIYESDANGGIDICLDCPLPNCVLDDTKYYKTRIRHREMRNLFYKGNTVPEVAARFGVSERTVQRAKERLDLEGVKV